MARGGNVGQGGDGALLRLIEALSAWRTVVRSTAKLATLDDFLQGEGKRDEFEAVAIKEVLACKSWRR